MPANVSTPARPLSPAPPDRTRRIVYDVMNAVVLVLSVLLIIVISIDTFKKVPLLESHRYMTFQFWVCVVFILDFFVGLVLSRRKWRFVRRRALFLLLSIPYLNIISVFDIHLSTDALYFYASCPWRGGRWHLRL